VIRPLSVGLSIFALLAVAFAAPVSAASPHFIGTPSINESNTTLQVNFKAAGLGNVETATFNLTGSVEVFSRCYNRGGNKPQADNKQETIPVNATLTVPVRNGQTSATFTLTAASTLQCPGNQVVRIESFEYNLNLTGEGLSFHFES
jgi:hypothetical protein